MVHGKGKLTMLNALLCQGSLCSLHILVFPSPGPALWHIGNHWHISNEYLYKNDILSALSVFLALQREVQFKSDMTDCAAE